MRARNSIRPAFTLIELMVVVVIIGILAAGITAVSVRVIESQRRSSTKLLFDTLTTALDAQKSKILQEIRKSPDTDLTRIDLVNELLDNTWTANFNWPSLSNPPTQYLTFTKGYFPTYAGGQISTLFSGSVTLASGDTFDGAEFSKAFHLFAILKQGKFSGLDPDSLGKAVQYATVSGAAQKVPYLADQWGDPIVLNFKGSGRESQPVISSKNLPPN